MIITAIVCRQGGDDMIKVIASDMDGTLLNSEHTISKRTYDIIQKVTKGGNPFYDCYREGISRRRRIH